MQTQTPTAHEPSVFVAETPPEPGCVRVYVGTYAKYNGGSIKGAWLDLEDLGSADAFEAACHKLHADEDDPEFMFQDFEGFPREFYGESCLDERLWDWINADEREREVWMAYIDNVLPEAHLSDAEDAFMGEGESETDWAQQWADDTGMLAEVPENLRHYFDWDAWVRDCKCEGMVFVRTGGRVLVFSG